MGGTTYAYRSASVTANSSLAEGVVAYTASARDNAGNTGSGSFSVTVDNTAPGVSASVIAPAAGTAVPGFVKAGSSYYVYANAVFQGSPIASLTVDVSTLTSGATAAAMTTTGGPWTVGGVSYAYRSALLTVGAGVAAGPASYVTTIVDTSSNSGTDSFSVTVDNTNPTLGASVIAPAGGSNVPGFIAQGGSYYVYANASDASAGISSLSADVSTITHRPDRRRADHQRAGRGPSTAPATPIAAPR